MTWILLATLVASGDLRVEPALSDSITIARLQYEGGGDWYANPSSLPNLLAAIPTCDRSILRSTTTPTST